MSLKDKLFSFDGRLRRRDWWILGIGWGALTSLVSGLVTLGLFGREHSILTSFSAWTEPAAPGPFVARGVVDLLFAWPVFALAIKRFHDRNKRAWFVVALTGLSYALVLVPEAALDRFMFGPAAGWEVAAKLILMAGFFGVWLYLLVALGLLDGSPGTNRFGPSPKAGERPTISEPGGME